LFSSLEAVIDQQELTLDDGADKKCTNVRVTGQISEKGMKG
jgi:hypothetical protein